MVAPRIPTRVWPSSAAVAASLASPDTLASVVGDISAHHAVFLGSSLPVWLADTLVNEFSHFRQMLWTQQVGGAPGSSSSLSSSRDCHPPLRAGLPAHG